MDKLKPIIALDFESKEETLNFLSLFAEQHLNLKIGMELFYKTGPELVKEITNAGHDIFLDLKLYDIPNTVHHAMIQLAQLGVSMVNVHANGGLKMMEAAKKGLEIGTKSGEKIPLLIGVTQLTSRDPEENVKEQQLSVTQKESILHLASLTRDSGLDGVVCSPLETKNIKEELGKHFLTVTPGIRLSNNTISNDDQIRVTTPELAAKWGSDYIVVGRPITQAKNPVEKYMDIKSSWENAKKAGI